MQSSLFILAAALIGALGSGDVPTTKAPRVLTSAIYPSPSSHGTTVVISLPTGSSETFELVLFDAIGRRVATAYRSELSFAPGTFEIPIDGRDADSGESIPPGYYFLALISGGKIVRAIKFVIG
jgi:hypothetical protein